MNVGSRDHGRRAIQAARMVNALRGAPPKGMIYISAESAAKAMNVSKESVRRAKTILKHGTEEEIRMVENGQRSVARVAAISRTGVPVAIPPGETLESATRAGISGGGFRASGLSRNVFQIARDCLNLLDQPLTGAERLIVKTAFETMERGQLRGVRDQIAPVKERVFGKGIRKTGSKVAAKRLEEFEIRVGVVTQACLAASDLHIPALEKDRLREVIGEVRQCERSLRALRSKLEKLQ